LENGASGDNHYTIRDKIRDALQNASRKFQASRRESSNSKYDIFKNAVEVL
jgi:hypothetical protein